MVSRNNDGCKEKVEAYCWILKRITPVTNNHDIKKTPGLFYKQRQKMNILPRMDKVGFGRAPWFGTGTIREGVN